MRINFRGTSKLNRFSCVAICWIFYQGHHMIVVVVLEVLGSGLKYFCFLMCCTSTKPIIRKQLCSAALCALTTLIQIRWAMRLWSGYVSCCIKVIYLPNRVLYPWNTSEHHHLKRTCQDWFKFNFIKEREISYHTNFYL